MTIIHSRAEVLETEKWNLADIFPSLKEWEEGVAIVENKTKKLKHFDGNIHSGEDLFAFLTLQEEVSILFNKIYVYGMLQTDLDTRDTEAQKLLDKAKHLSVKINSSCSFFMPYLLQVKESTLKEYIKNEPHLTYFEKDLYESYRYKEHVLSKEKEEILSQLGETFSSPSNTYGMLNNADIKFGDITLENGEKVELTRGMYSKLIENENRDTRKEAFQAYYNPYLQLKNSIASTLSSTIKNNVTLSRIRKHTSTLDKALFGDNVSKDVYENLIAATKENIEPMIKYNRIRKEMLGLEELHQYDLSVPLVKDVKHEIKYEEAYEIMLNSLSPLGEDYVNTLKEFKQKRYIDVRETKGKRSGAYNLGLYGVHPFVLLNHHDDLDSLFTLSHEMGHAMHSHYSNKHQPAISAGYSIFVAEVASTVNEVLLINYLLKNEKDPEAKKHLLNHFIDQFKGTFFTQVMFAEFEKKTHELAEQGQALTVEVFNNIYGELLKEYNGNEIVFDEETKYGWARIPHFYRPYYVYKYATGFASAIHIATQLLNGDKDAQSAYLEFLKSGSSDYPLELLKKTGVDLTSPEPIKNAMKLFGELVEEFSKS